MKSKALIILSTLAMALALMAQSSTQTTPTPSDNAPKSCACCNHDQAAGAECCGKGADCCKDGACCEGKDGKQCPMAAKDAGAKNGCCGGVKCPMMAKHEGKSCCGGKMCARPHSGA